MDSQIQLLLQQLVAPEKITDPALEAFGASIATTIYHLSDENLNSTLETIRVTLLSKGSSAYDLHDDNYERIVMIYFMRGVFHAIRPENKDNADIIWKKMSAYFKSKQPPEIKISPEQIKQAHAVEAISDNIAASSTSEENISSEVKDNSEETTAI